MATPVEQAGQFGMWAPTRDETLIPHGKDVGAPICSVRKQPHRPTAMPSATAGAKKVPGLLPVPHHAFAGERSEISAGQSSEDALRAADPAGRERPIAPRHGAPEGRDPGCHSTAEQRRQDDPDELLGDHCAPSRLVEEDDGGSEDAEQDEEVVGSHLEAPHAEQYRHHDLRLVPEDGEVTDLGELFGFLAGGERGRIERLVALGVSS